MNKYFFKVLISLFVLSVSIYVAVSFVMRPVKINDNAMHPTYDNGDYILTNVFNKTTNRIEDGQVAVIKTDNSYVVRRIIAGPNSKIEMINNNLYVNGQRKYEEYLNQEYMANQQFPFTENFSLTTGENEYFVMGDNRVDSIDSRNSLGNINIKDIVSVGVFVGGGK